MVLVFSIGLPAAKAAQLSVRVGNLPADGELVIQVYDNANAFGDFRNPRIEQRFAVRADGRYLVDEVPAGMVAVLVYLDQNRNGSLDRNFIGIPRESIGLSNGYRPKGPPSFQRASFLATNDAVTDLDIELYRALGESGQWGVGLGVIALSSPYRDSDQNVSRVIPAVTYFGERLQWVGPEIRYGLLGSDDLRLALIASYRIGVYEENDSPVLAGLGDREDTLLGGLGLIYETEAGIDFDLRYQHDVLDRIGGGAAALRVSKAFQLGVVRLRPLLGVNWLSRKLGDHDFGVPRAAANAARSAYSVGDSSSLELGFGGLVEISENWRAAFNFAVEYLDDEVTDSPIVEEDQVFKGFAALTYTF